jgi:hypothetical protein
MTSDFRILTAQGELQVSRVIRRAESLFAFPPAVGLVVGTYGSVPYVHLQLEARRRFYPDVSLLVHDDGSSKGDELRRLCEEYGCEFETNESRRLTNIGDISCFLGGLLWAQWRHLDLLVKVSRRFLPVVNWVPELQELAMASQYATYSNFTESFNFGFRSECVGMAVNEWIDHRVHEQLAAIALGPREPFVEAVLHNIARRLAATRCEQAVQWDKARGLRPSDRDGYAPWEFMGTDRCRRYPQFLWHDSASPEDYHRLACEWGLAYSMEDFLDPNQGFGSPG